MLFICFLQDTKLYLGKYDAAAMRQDSQLDRLLAPLLRPRVVGTQSHADVREVGRAFSMSFHSLGLSAPQFIAAELRALGWNVEFDVFEDATPLGKKPFTNIGVAIACIKRAHTHIPFHYIGWFSYL